MTSTRTGSTFVKRHFRPALGGIILGLSLGGFVLPAAASNTAPIKETTGYGPGTAVTWDTPRTNSHTNNGVSFALTSWTPGTGGYIVFSMVNSTGSTVYAKTKQMISYKSWPFYKGSSTVLTPGTFYLNTYVEGACGGNGCGNQTFKGTLTWNIDEGAG